MKLFTKTLCYFILTTLLAYPTGVIVYGYFVSGPGFIKTVNYQRLKEAKQVSEVDILFLGPSHAVRGFDPRIFEAHGLSTFNLGSSGQTPKNTLLLIKEYLPKIRPKMVVYEVSPISLFSLLDFESTMDIILNDPSLGLSVSQLLEHKNIKLLNSWIYSQVSAKIPALDSINTQPNFRKGDRYIEGGYIENKECSFLYARQVIDIDQYGLHQLAAISEGATLIKAQGIPVIFVSAPVLRDYFKGYDKADAVFKKFIRDYQPYYDFNELLSLSDVDHFCDPNHLNHQGVEIFDQKLLEVIDEMN